LFEDLLRRVVRLAGWSVNQVMNLTDVDDMIIKRAVQQGSTIYEVTEPVTQIFHDDRQYLRIEDAERYPKATESIEEMIELVSTLMERGVAYEADDRSIYFAIDRFPSYGKLSRLDTRDIQAGARVAQDEYSKENAQDFALWKAAKPEDEACGAAWDSPWGRGRPGWHLECSAMAMRFLGETLDIHCGGIDLVFPHHEDEIAQSEAASGKEFSRFWCHGEFLLTDGTKMAKRVGNVATVQDLRDQGVSAAAFRHFVFSTHYRKQLNLSPETLEASIRGVRRVGDFAERLEEVAGSGVGWTPELAQAADELEQAATAAFFEDLNAPEAMGALFTFINRAHAELDRGGDDPAAVQRARTAFHTVNGVLDIVPAAEAADSALVAYVEAQLARRREARARRDFAQSDAIRDDLIARGIAIEDGPQGTRWKKVR
jgi:cysteinyl-tRNA synthetase